jgi:hypothetical protein
MIIGTVSGETALGPRSRRRVCCSSSVAIPPTPVPTMHPTLSGLVQGLLGRADRQLGEAVGAPHLLLAHHGARIEGVAGGVTAGDSRLARYPALGQDP